MKTYSVGKLKWVQKFVFKNDESLVEFVDHFIAEAIESHASDIHIEPYEAKLRIRYRRDGILQEVYNLALELALRITARLKIMAELDIAERRIPQDGRFKARLSNQPWVDFRISTCPTLFGEKIVLRLLDPYMTAFNLSQLGFTPRQEKIFLNTLSRPQGMILVTGPTGSGKTVTQYAALHHLNEENRNILTVEDPVEIYMEGINQVHVNPKVGLSFATVLRAFLRQDPDVIMIGEIRDLETAEIAIKAAQTGHLVFSTLHTNSAVESLTRLANMGIPTFNIISAVTLVIAQRLVRKLCSFCKKSYVLPGYWLKEAAFEQKEDRRLYQPVGCSACIKGYAGRTSIYEMLPMSDSIKSLVMSHAHHSLKLTQAAVQEGMWTLRRSGLEKVKQGTTSLEEINNATIS